ncbi:MAG: Gfo/Idh/MocA family oxidoreductase [Kiritimatiellae bacterium]|nr:Gfo/Idh/MocA family oxidoreductase [Kiritimatiellia bacterium]
MESNRRDFLKGMAWMGAAAMAAGCNTGRVATGLGAPMQAFAAPPLKKVRVGVVGLGQRGPGAVHRIAGIPGVEVCALCDIYEQRVARQVKWLKDNGKPAPKTFYGSKEEWRKMCEWDGIDVVYNTTCWDMHVPVALYAMECGKHVFIEVPAAMTIEDCFALIDASERTQRHCMQLENCCYGEAEMFALNLCRQGILGELVHGEGAYIHDLRSHCYKTQAEGSYYNSWRLRWNIAHKGNQYPTHGLGPVCQYMNINRGDRFEYLVSLESNQFNYESYGRLAYPAGDWRHTQKVGMGDMNTTLVKTALGRSILIQHDVSSPRPYSRINKITGTKGTFTGGFFGQPEAMARSEWPGRMTWEDAPGDGKTHEYFDPKKAAAMREKYRHPLWKTAGEIAKKVGGHGGMDFLMDLRWAFCLQNGLPLDMDVYDLAAWCSICELSERSVRSHSAPQEVPDFTNGGWRTAKPLGIVDVDLQKMNFDAGKAKADKSALNV